MVVNHRVLFSKNIKKEKGQAVFELLVFLPIFLFLFSVIYNIGNSINTSINQEKVVRRYFYYTQKGNSFLPGNYLLNVWKGNGLKYAGVGMIAFQDKSIGQSPLAPCFEFPTFLTGSSGEVCDDKIEGNESNFIKIMTAYGVCGETFRLTDLGHWIHEFSDGEGAQNLRSLNTSCRLGN